MCINFSKNFTTLRPSAHSKISIVGTLKIGHYMQENGLLVFFHLILVPENFFVSTFGSDQFSVYPNFGSRIADIRFSGKSVQGLHFEALFKISRCIMGQNVYLRRDIITRLPGCVVCSYSGLRLGCVVCIIS